LATTAGIATGQSAGLAVPAGGDDWGCPGWVARRPGVTPGDCHAAGRWRRGGAQPARVDREAALAGDPAERSRRRPQTWPADAAKPHAAKHRSERLDRADDGWGACGWRC